jgi:hypothetical protein
MIEQALWAWFEQYGREARSTDLSLSYARACAPRDGGIRLRRLQQGWAGGRWPAASVVQYHYGTIRRANQAAIGDGKQGRSPVSHPAQHPRFVGGNNEASSDNHS